MSTPAGVAGGFCASAGVERRAAIKAIRPIASIGALYRDRTVHAGSTSNRLHCRVDHPYLLPAAQYTKSGLTAHAGAGTAKMERFPVPQKMTPETKP
jgi:hypothetical protein